MKVKKLAGVMAVLLLSVSVLTVSVQAEETGGSSITGNVSLTTDYLFRGQSQTAGSAAIQGGIDWDSEFGFYAGIWASSVDFGSAANAEVDYYIGYAGSLADSVEYDIGYIYYGYAGESALDYQELALAVGVQDLTVGLNYSDEYLGDGGESFYYLSASYEFALPAELALGVSAGYNKADEMDITFDGTGDDSYIDWSAVLSRNFMGVGLSLGYYGTNIGSQSTLADEQLVFSIGKSL